MDFGPAFGGRPFFVGASASGVSPGTSLPGATLPLNMDPLLAGLVSSPNSTFVNLGLLSGAGRGLTSVYLLPGSQAFLGYNFQFAAVTMDRMGRFVASNFVVLYLDE